MGLFARFWHYSVETYGGAPVLLVINLIQLAVLGWVISQTLRAQAERATRAASAPRSGRRSGTSRCARSPSP